MSSAQQRPDRDDEFLFQVPLWFVVAERATDIDQSGKRRLAVTGDLDLVASAFCSASKDSVVLFTDEDLAERHAETLRHIDEELPLATLRIDDVDETIRLLEGFYPTHFKNVSIDPMARLTGRGLGAWTNRTVPIPSFIESLKKPLPENGNGTRGPETKC